MKRVKIFFRYNWMRGMATTLSLAIVANSVGVSFASSNFWEERQAKVAKFAPLGPSSSTQTNLANHHPILASFISNSLSIPRELGAIVETHWAEKNAARSTSFTVQPSIIHIQDAHTIVSAQTNAARILQVLLEAQSNDSAVIASIAKQSQGSSVSEIATSPLATRNDNTASLLVCVEGAWSPLYTLTDWLASFPVPQARDEVSWEYLQAGKLYGEEYQAIVSGPGVIRIVGVEDKKLYLANDKAEKDSANDRQAMLASIQTAESAINILKAHIFPERLHELDSKGAAWNTQKLSLSDYLVYLMGLIDGDIQSRYPNLGIFRQVSKLEKQFDVAKFEKTREALIKNLTEQLPQKDIKALIDFTYKYRLGEVSPVAYHEALIAMAEKHGFHDFNILGSLKKYASYLKLYESIDHAQFSKEITNMEHSLQNQLATSNESKQLVHSIEWLSLQKKLWSLQMTPDDWATYKNVKERTQEKWISLEKFVNAQLAKYKFYHIPALQIATHSPRDVEKYYEYAWARNDALVKNTLAELEKSGTARAILIAGGFHTPGLTELLKKSNVSYTVVMPNMDLPNSLQSAQETPMVSLNHENLHKTKRALGLLQGAMLPGTHEIEAGLAQLTDAMVEHVNAVDMTPKIESWRQQNPVDVGQKSKRLEKTKAAARKVVQSFNQSVKKPVEKAQETLNGLRKAASPIRVQVSPQSNILVERWNRLRYFVLDIFQPILATVRRVRGHISAILSPENFNGLSYTRRFPILGENRGSVPLFGRENPSRRGSISQPPQSRNDTVSVLSAKLERRYPKLVSDIKFMRRVIREFKDRTGNFRNIEPAVLGSSIKDMRYGDTEKSMVPIYDVNADKLRREFRDLDVDLVVEDPAKPGHEFSGFMGNVENLINRGTYFGNRPVVIVSDGGFKTRLFIKTLAYGYNGLMTLLGGKTFRQLQVEVLVPILSRIGNGSGFRDFLIWGASDNFTIPGGINWNGKDLEGIPPDRVNFVATGIKTILITRDAQEKISDVVRSIGKSENLNSAWITIAGDETLKNELANMLKNKSVYQKIEKRIRDERVKALGVFAVNPDDGTLTWFGQKVEDEIELIRRANLNGGSLYKNVFLELANKRVVSELLSRLKREHAVSPDIGTLDKMPVPFMSAVYESRFIEDANEWIRLGHKNMPKYIQKLAEKNDAYIKNWLQDWNKMKEIIDNVLGKGPSSAESIFAIDLGPEAIWVDAGDLEKIVELQGLIATDSRYRIAVNLPEDKNMINYSFSKVKVERSRKYLGLLGLSNFSFKYNKLTGFKTTKEGHKIHKTAFVNNVVVEGGGRLILEPGVVLQDVWLNLQPSPNPYIIPARTQILESDFQYGQLTFASDKYQLSIAQALSIYRHYKMLYKRYHRLEYGDSQFHLDELDSEELRQSLKAGRRRVDKIVLELLNVPASLTARAFVSGLSSVTTSRMLDAFNSILVMPDFYSKVNVDLAALKPNIAKLYTKAVIYGRRNEPLEDKKLQLLNRALLQFFYPDATVRSEMYRLNLRKIWQMWRYRNDGGVIDRYFPEAGHHLHSRPDEYVVSLKVDEKDEKGNIHTAYTRPVHVISLAVSGVTLRDQLRRPSNPYWKAKLAKTPYLFYQRSGLYDVYERLDRGREARWKALQNIHINLGRGAKYEDVKNQNFLEMKHKGYSVVGEANFERAQVELVDYTWLDKKVEELRDRIKAKIQPPIESELKLIQPNVTSMPTSESEASDKTVPLLLVKNILFGVLASLALDIGSSWIASVGLNLDLLALDMLGGLLLVAAVHELGHAVAIRVSTGKWPEFVITKDFIGVRKTGNTDLTRFQAAAGPLSVLIAIPLAFILPISWPFTLTMISIATFVNISAGLFFGDADTIWANTKSTEKLGQTTPQQGETSSSGELESADKFGKFSDYIPDVILGLAIVVVGLAIMQVSFSARGLFVATTMMAGAMAVVAGGNKLRKEKAADLKGDKQPLTGSLLSKKGKEDSLDKFRTEVDTSAFDNLGSLFVYRDKIASKQFKNAAGVLGILASNKQSIESRLQNFPKKSNELDTPTKIVESREEFFRDSAKLLAIVGAMDTLELMNTGAAEIKATLEKQAVNLNEVLGELGTYYKETFHAKLDLNSDTGKRFKVMLETNYNEGSTLLENSTLEETATANELQNDEPPITEGVEVNTFVITRRDLEEGHLNALGNMFEKWSDGSKNQVFEIVTDMATTEDFLNAVEEHHVTIINEFGPDKSIYWKKLIEQAGSDSQQKMVNITTPGQLRDFINANYEPEVTMGIIDEESLKQAISNYTVDIYYLWLLLGKVFQNRELNNILFYGNSEIKLTGTTMLAKRLAELEIKLVYKIILAASLRTGFQLYNGGIENTVETARRITINA